VLVDYFQKIFRFIHFKSGRRLLLEAVFLLGISRLAIWLVPFRKIAPRLGRLMVETEASATPDTEIISRKIAFCVHSAARNLPWECKCLVQAMATKAMLRRRGLQSTLYLGVAKAPQNDLSAHAWLRFGSLTLTGGAVRDDYTVVAFFGG
jgi:hypothetical protein